MYILTLYGDKEWHMVDNQSSDRTPRIMLDKQLKQIADNDFVRNVLDGMNIFVIIMNTHREIIYINTELCNALGVKIEDCLGFRPGKLLKCKYAHTSDEGCGFSEECALCEAKNLMVKTMQSHEQSDGLVSIVSLIKELEITSVFQQRVTEVKMGKEIFYMAAFVDKSSDVEKNNIERIFFHDVLNSATGLYNIVRLLRQENDQSIDKLDVSLLEEYIKNIIEEIEYQRDIASAENNELSINNSQIDIGAVINGVIIMMLGDERFKAIKVDSRIPEKQYYVMTDGVLLRRIFVNMLKNAMEANQNQSIIRISIEADVDNYKIIFHNDECIPEHIQREIFVKGKTTKENGRGYGTYGSKLLLAKYLGGKLHLNSSEALGTSFIVMLEK